MAGSESVAKTSVSSAKVAVVVSGEAGLLVNRICIGINKLGIRMFFNGVHLAS
jgi:hypothetical protein